MNGMMSVVSQNSNLGVVDIRSINDGQHLVDPKIDFRPAEHKETYIFKLQTKCNRILTESNLPNELCPGDGEQH